MEKNDIMQAVLNAVRDKQYTPQPPDRLLALPALEGVQKRDLAAALEQLERQGALLRSKRGKIMTVEQGGFLAGRLEGTARGFCFVEGDQERLFVPERDRGDALHGDTVLCKITRAAQGNQVAEGAVTRVLQRGRSHILGVYQNRGAQGVVFPDDARYNTEFVVKRGSASPGDRVWMEITGWPLGGSAPRGTVREALGPAGEFSVNYHAILLQHGIRTDYPAQAVEQAESLRRRGVLESDAADRLDLRHLPAFTVDGADAKDFDDALTFEELPQGGCRLGVHIADVSHYVPENSHIDQEAKLRGTSIYFTDQVVPMLPPALSDDLCSLRPGEDRLTLSCLMELDSAAAVTRYEIRHSVIRSRVRCVYSELNRLLAGEGEPEPAKRYEAVLPTIRSLKQLADKLTAARRARGALTFETIEPKILVDADAQPTDIVAVPRGDTERMIEECMLLANRTVARHLQRHKLPGVYRNHGAPPPDKLRDLKIALQAFGLELLLPDADQAESPEGYAAGCAFELQRICDAVMGQPLEQAVMGLLIRSMSRANYSATNKGHYGLAEADYCHFTSPIRRYPDLLVHRSLTLAAQKDARALARLAAQAPELAKQSFECEERAMAAERDIEDLYKCLYMSRFLGDQFEGVVTGVTGFGLFVSLPNTVEGLLHISELDDDYYNFDEQQRTLTGRHTGRMYKLGMPLSVTLVKSDPESRRIDFILTPTQTA